MIQDPYVHEDHEVALYSKCQEFVRLYKVMTASIVPGDHCPDSEYGKISSDTYLKLHLLLHAAGARLTYGPVCEYTTGMCLPSSFVFGS